MVKRKQKLKEHHWYMVSAVVVVVVLFGVALLSELGSDEAIAGKGYWFSIKSSSETSGTIIPSPEKVRAGSSSKVEDTREQEIQIKDVKEKELINYVYPKCPSGATASKCIDDFSLLCVFPDKTKAIINCPCSGESPYAQCN